MRFVGGIAAAAAWPFERVAWSLERRLLWPLRERIAGSTPSGNRAGAAALGAIAIAAVLAGVLVLGGGSGGAPSGHVAVKSPVAIATPEPQPQPERSRRPALQGAPPHFGVAKGVGVSGGGGDAGATSSDAAATEAEPGGEASPSEEGAAATTSSAKPVPAGPAAMKVAHRFAAAFVFYEIGKRPDQAKAVFAETATQRLAGTLAKRPPRLPENAVVPKARVVNLVPGPRRGKAYTVSVSLLRVGLTSELRLTLEPGKDGDWRVAEILG